MAFMFRGLLGRSENENAEKSGAAAVKHFSSFTISVFKYSANKISSSFKVEKLLHRIESVTLPVDRREGLRALKAIAKVKPQFVGFIIFPNFTWVF